MVVLYLYSEVMGYQMPILDEYVKVYGADVHVVHWNHKKLSHYSNPLIHGVSFYKRSEFTKAGLKEFVEKLKPDIIYISGWMDIGYLAAVLPLRLKGTPVVTAFDDIWFGTLKQKVASFFFPFIKSFFFSHAWVAGPYQYEYAKRLGFKNNNILFNCLSADTLIFNKAFIDSISNKAKCYPHRFLYVGRFEIEKGVDILANAWSNLKSKNECKDWGLTLIGNGSLRDSLSILPEIEIINFLNPEKLGEEIVKYGCLILPSRNEQWGVVLHEFTSAGFPIICSDICGATPVFVVKGFNGNIFKSGSVADLEKQILWIMNMSDDELKEMSFRSNRIGQKISPELVAASFMSIIR
jgi:glycosyltransferase involved in cell wall biosynthesis